MSCISYHNIDDVLIGVWKIEENIQTLMSMAYMDEADEQKYRSFRSTSRRLEFLSVRALLAEMLGKTARIVYNKNNKPFLKDGSRFISITHSHDLTAIICSPTCKVGIDLEYMRPSIASISFKFINRKESVTKNKQLKKNHLYIHWCAKEAIYKICDKEGISIKNNIFIEHFDVKNYGKIKGKVVTKKIDDIFDLQYCKYENYTIVWTKKTYEELHLS